MISLYGKNIKTTSLEPSDSKGVRYVHTGWLYDWIGPEGRFSEKVSNIDSAQCIKYKDFYTSVSGCSVSNRSAIFVGTFWDRLEDEFWEAFI